MKIQLFRSWKHNLIFLLCLIWLAGCNNDEGGPDESEIIVRTTAESFNLGTHILSGISSTERGVTVIYDSGLGHDYTVWTLSGVLREVGKYNTGVAYSRGGYGSSELGPVPRNLIQLSDELLQLKELVSPNNKVVLVGHSFGGAIIRTFAIRFPDQIHGLVFVDPSHEDALILNQQQEDDLVQSYASIPGASKESETLIESVAYLRTLPNLPDVPITVLTSLLGSNPSAWTALHRSLGFGVSGANFTHITTTNAGHNIHLEEPSLVIQAINDLIAKLD